MPLTSEQFRTAAEEQLNEAAERAYTFLRQNSHLAYTAAEVADELAMDARLVRTALEEIYFAGLAEGGDVDGKTYFLYKTQD